MHTYKIKSLQPIVKYDDLHRHILMGTSSTNLLTDDPLKTISISIAASVDYTANLVKAYTYLHFSAERWQKKSISCDSNLRINSISFCIFYCNVTFSLGIGFYD